jgi:hypothetical protein
MKTFWNRTLSLLDKYSILVSALVIYSYFLLTSINLMGHAQTKKTILDFILQFDSLILMWVIAFVVVQLQKYRALNTEQELSHKKMQSDMERQRAKLKLLDEVTLLFQESINKPIAVVSNTTQNLREKFGEDAEARSWVDHIDFAMARVSATVNDIKTYETQKIVGESPILVPAEPARR